MIEAGRQRARRKGKAGQSVYKHYPQDNIPPLRMTTRPSRLSVAVRSLRLYNPDW